MNWLIAEDEADIRNLVGIMCQVWGHNPLTFETGQKVWDWLDEVEAGRITANLPDFALMDIRMPGKRGNEIAIRMRDVEKLKDIPIVLMTAFVLSEDEIDRLRQDYGVDHVINKPLPDFDRLGVILHDIIKKKQAANAAAKAAASVAPAPSAAPTEATPAVSPPTVSDTSKPVAPASAEPDTPKPSAPSQSDPTRQHPIQQDPTKPK